MMQKGGLGGGQAKVRAAKLTSSHGGTIYQSDEAGLGNEDERERDRNG